MSCYRFALSALVQLHPSQPASSVMWRGQQPVPHPEGGGHMLVNVYLLDNGYWDCYYEDELHAAWQ